MKLNVLRADPAGNITLFVMDPVERSLYGKVAEKLMAIEEFRAEQVGYYCPPTGEADGHMYMMGGEFCGNATRAFGMLIAKEKGGASNVLIETSGCDHLVNVVVDLEAGTSRSEMPLPLSVRDAEVDGHKGVLVNLGGIAHFIVEGVAPDQAFFDKAEPLFQDIEGLDAYGVMFHNNGKMDPLVKVPAANSLVWEGSCGSGSLASAIAQSQDLVDGEFAKDYIQPAGIVRATAVRKGGEVVATFIGGPVSLDEPVEVEVEL